MALSDIETFRREAFANSRVEGMALNPPVSAFDAPPVNGPVVLRQLRHFALSTGAFLRTNKGESPFKISSKIKMGILDTGVDVFHPDLTGRFVIDTRPGREWD